jgi:ABC-type glycerol-3-phosphate transport system substrate-binding protein
VARTWAFALIAQDAAERALALDLVERLLDPSVHAAWSQAAHHLPTRPTAYQALADRGDYSAFLDEQLDHAVAMPNGRAFSETARRVQAAQAAIVKGDKSAEAALAEIQAAP